MSMSELLKNEDFLSILNDVMSIQGDRDEINFMSYIAPKIGFNNNGYNQFKNHLVIYTNKFLKVDQLFIILDNLDSDLQKQLLDYIASKYDFVLSHKATTTTTNNHENIKDLLLSFSSQNGLLINAFFDFSSDNNVDELEKEELRKLSYAFRCMLVHFEDSL